MAVNPELIQRTSFIGRPSDRGLFLAGAIGFPFIVLLGFYKSYIFRVFFEVPPIANMLVHLHGISMMAWVIYFTMQIALIRTKNIKLHITMGMIGIALAIFVFTIGMATAYDSQIVRGSAPPGLDPRKFFLIPFFDMVVFALLFGGAIYFRKRAAEHKGLMLLTAINFCPSPLSRILWAPPADFMVWSFGPALLLTLAALGWHTWKHRKLNKVFAIGAAILIVSAPLRVMIGETETWARIADWLAG